MKFQMHKLFIQQRQFHLPSQMKCIQIEKYAPSISKLHIKETVKCPTALDLGPEQAIVKVHAASVNPFDLEMTNGYGEKAMNVFRNISKSPVLPLILGRDCSGIIVERGKRFRRFKLNDQVWCVRWIVGQGTHAEYVIVNKNEVSLKPKNISFIQAASLPYVACTVWNALINTGAVSRDSSLRQKIFIPGGTGGIGSFALQLCQAFGHEVYTSCAADGIELIESLGIENVFVYTSKSFEEDLIQAGPFDVILDTLNEKYITFFQKLLKNSSKSRYVSLRPSLLPNMDEKGVLLGLAQSSQSFIKTNVTQISSNKGVYVWGFFSPNALILDQVRPLVERGLIKPVIDKVFPIESALDAYQYLANGHSRGKTVLSLDE